jgi:hypothetical protein
MIRPYIRPLQPPIKNIYIAVAGGDEPGLALMDEIGRRALTDAFIRFTKETAKTHRFLYNPNNADFSLGSPIENPLQHPEEDDGDEVVLSTVEEWFLAV